MEARALQSLGVAQESPAVVVDRLVKTYDTHRAVDGVSFDIQRGEIFALLGPNGAGKTTTVEILEGYRRPDSGSVRVLDCDPIAGGNRLKAQIGVMLQEGGLYPAITPLEALRLFGHFYERPRDPNELIHLVGLDDAARTRYRGLSGGQKQRLALALALIPNPELVFLDEPTTGLDPQARRLTWELIAGLRSDRVTVLLTTHYLEEAERLADRIAIMDEGRLVALDTPAALLQSGGSEVRMRTENPVDLALLRSLPSALDVRLDRNTYVLEASSVPDLLVEVTTAMRDRGTAIAELRAGGASLEDVFLELTGKELPE